MPNGRLRFIELVSRISTELVDSTRMQMPFIKEAPAPEVGVGQSEVQVSVVSSTSE